MKRNDGVRRSRRLIWGLFLIALGGAFLLERLGVVWMPEMGRLWPLLFIVMGTADAVSGRFSSAALFTILGAWLLACEFGWRGLTYGNSWGLALVALGASIVVSALTGQPASVRVGIIAGRGDREQGATEDCHD